MGLVEELVAKLGMMTAEQKAEIQKAVQHRKAIWFPNPGPQTQAFESPADELFYGGSAGGG